MKRKLAQILRPSLFHGHRLFLKLGHGHRLLPVIWCVVSGSNLVCDQMGHGTAPRTPNRLLANPAQAANR
jgi:hypothetical protein